MDESISLSQNLFMLGIHPQKGGIIGASYTAMDYVLIGSLLIELYKSKNIKFENKKVLIINRKSENKLHQFLLDKMIKPARPLSISRWIGKLHISIKFVKKEVQNNLVRKRIIRMEPKRFLFFSWKRPYLVNKQVVYHLVDTIESNIFKGTSSEDDLILLSFLKPGGLLNRVFPEKAKRKHAKVRLKKLMTENQVSQAVADAISAAQAVAASVAVSAAATSAATS